MYWRGAPHGRPGAGSTVAGLTFSMRIAARLTPPIASRSQGSPHDARGCLPGLPRYLPRHSGGLRVSWRSRYPICGAKAAAPTRTRFTRASARSTRSCSARMASRSAAKLSASASTYAWPRFARGERGNAPRRSRQHHQGNPRAHLGSARHPDKGYSRRAGRLPPSRITAGSGPWPSISGESPHQAVAWR